MNKDLHFGVYARYGLRKHKALLDVWPEIAVGMVLDDTYEAASDKARQLVEGAIPEGVEADWVFHPHRADSEDPLGLFGSWGARW